MKPYITKLTGDLQSYRSKLDSIQHQYLSADIASYQNLSEYSTDLIIYGTALTEGTHKDGVYYTSDELKKAASKLKGVRIFYDTKSNGKKHNPVAENQVGYITQSYYDEKSKAIKYEAVVKKPGVIQLITKGLLKAVSMGVGSFKKIVNDINYATELLFKEMSLVFNPADKNAQIQGFKHGTV